MEVSRLGVNFIVDDIDSNSKAVEYIVNEINAGFYDLNVRLSDEDVILDIGAHVGCISIFYAKLYPNIKIYAFEPFPQNYAQLVKNLEKNNITNVTAYNLAITKDGRDFHMVQGLDNSGGATGCVKDTKPDGHRLAMVKSIILDDFLKSINVDRCMVMKIDCEGAEHEILKTMKTPVRYLLGEFHENSFLIEHGHSIAKLKEYCIDNGIKLLYIQECQMADF